MYNLIAKILALPFVREWLIKRAKKTPYFHITSADGTDIYMERYWLFNPYGRDEQGNTLPAKIKWLPSIRLHWIRREDRDRHLHDHPWDARTILLGGWYEEERLELNGRVYYLRKAGQSAKLRYGQYHRIICISQGGVWTMFITWKYKGVWGFLVDGKKVPWKQYLKEHK
jgi:hypothetical protein